MNTRLPAYDDPMMMFTSDELLLALVSLVRVTRPALLRQEGDSFTMDFESIAAQKDPGPDERLLLKMHAALESTGENLRAQLEIGPSESRRLAGTLGSLEKLQPWSPDVLQMTRDLRARLLTVAGTHEG